MGQRAYLSKSGVARRDMKVVRTIFFSKGQHRACKLPRKRCLADAFWTCEEPRMMKLSRSRCFRQSGTCVSVPEQFFSFSGVRQVTRTITFGQRFLIRL